MRTTLDIENDALQAAREHAKAERTTIGKFVSKAVRYYVTGGDSDSKRKYIYKNGVPVLPKRPGSVITMEHVQKLMEEEGM